MSISEVKEKLHQYIDQADERFVKAVYAMMQQYLQEEEAIVAYTVQGKPLTKADMLSEVEEAVNTVKKNGGYTSDDNRKAKENW